jgi:hypothetical protein
MKNLRNLFVAVNLMALAGSSFALECEGGIGTKFFDKNNQLHCTRTAAEQADRAAALAVGGVAFVQRPPTVQFVPVQQGTGLFRVNNEHYHCPALAKWGGGVLGATLGHAAGKEIKVSHGNLGGLGALLGIVAGVDITCELVKPNTTSVTEGSRTVTTGQATSGVACNVAGTTVIVNTTDHCVTLAKKIAEGGGTQSVQLANLATVTGSIGVCKVNTGSEVYRFNAVKGVKFGPDQCDRYLKKVDPLPPKEDMSVL